MSSEVTLCTDKGILYSYLKCLPNTKIYFDFILLVLDPTLNHVLKGWKIILKGIKLPEFPFTCIHFLYTGSLSAMIYSTSHKENILFEGSFGSLSTGLYSVL